MAKKMTWGLNGAKLGAHIREEQRRNGTVLLHTIRDGNGDEHTWLVTGYVAVRVPAYLYKTLIQPHTQVEAPAFGETKCISGPERDGTSLIRNVEKMMEDAQAMTARDTWFSADFGERGKTRTLRVYALEDGTPVACGADLADIFERMQDVRYHGTGRSAPLTIRGPYIQGLVMPVRVGDDLRERMAALCAAFKAERAAA